MLDVASMEHSDVFMLAFMLISQTNKNTYNMKQLQQIFDSIVEAVIQASGLEFDALANCRSERCVVARVVLCCDIKINITFIFNSYKLLF